MILPETLAECNPGVKAAHYGLALAAARFYEAPDPPVPDGLAEEDAEAFEETTSPEAPAPAPPVSASTKELPALPPEHRRPTVEMWVSAGYKAEHYEQGMTDWETGLRRRMADGWRHVRAQGRRRPVGARAIRAAVGPLRYRRARAVQDHVLHRQRWR